MECVAHLDRVAADERWSPEELHVRRKSLERTIEYARRDETVLALFTHGTYAVRVRAADGGTVIEQYSPLFERWDLQERRAAEPTAVRAAIEDAKHMFVCDVKPCEDALNTSEGRMAPDDGEVLRTECLDLARAHLQSGGERCLHFLRSYAERLMRTESGKLRQKGQGIMALCEDPLFAAEAERLQRVLPGKPGSRNLASQP